jgi:hypothetical protein
MKKAIYNLLGKIRLTSYPLQVYVVTRQYLKAIGWLESKHQNMPLDKNRKPIPWLTYPIVHFLSQRVNKNHNVLEFGSGNSTIWFAERVQSIISIEYDKEFYNLIEPQLTSHNNSTYILAKLKDNYHQQLFNYKKQFEIILVDGRERVDCVKNALPALTESGVIILDNSDRVEYKEAYDFLASNGFKFIDFRGLSPAGIVDTQTTIFYRENNCFEI